MIPPMPAKAAAVRLGLRGFLTTDGTDFTDGIRLKISYGDFRKPKCFQPGNFPVPNFPSEMDSAQSGETEKWKQENFGDKTLATIRLGFRMFPYPRPSVPSVVKHLRHPQTESATPNFF